MVGRYIGATSSGRTAGGGRASEVQGSLPALKPQAFIPRFSLAAGAFG